MTILTPGTIFDGLYGHYNERRIIALAIEHGWQEQDARSALNNEPEAEEWDDLLSRAANFLSTLTPQGYSFTSTEAGDWGVYPDEPVEITEKDQRDQVQRVTVLSREEAVARLRPLKLNWKQARPLSGDLRAEHAEGSYEVAGLDTGDLEPEPTSQ